ncbi:MAG: nucleotidyltransferase family protein [Pseudomonadota bacterium]
MKFGVSKEQRALLLLSRLFLDESDEKSIVDAVESIEDINSLTRLATSRLCLPLVYKNLQSIFKGSLHSTTDLKDAREKTALMRVLSLQVRSEMVEFHSNCIAPFSIDHVYFKGPALEDRYYTDKGIRLSRDIDVLIRKEAMEFVVRTAMAHGYRVKTMDNAEPTVPDEGQIRALLRYDKVVTLVSKIGILIEVHTELDQQVGLFSAHDFIIGGEDLDFEGHNIRVLNTTHLFCYVCFHNSRHLWSRLHWLSDLDAIMSHPSYNETKVQEFSKNIGVSSTVVATQKFAKLAGCHDICKPSSIDEKHAIDLLKMCSITLSRGPDEELRLRKKYNIFGLPFFWMIDRGFRLKALAHTLRSRIKPSYYQYDLYPVPDYLQFFYVPSKPIFWLLRRFYFR